MAKRIQGKNWSLTYNNPTVSLDTFLEALQQNGAVYARAQEELSESGTPHFQACVGYDRNIGFDRVKGWFKGCHVSKSGNALKAWNYCGKESTRVKGPVEFGIPPASRAVKGDTKARNKMILEYGLTKAIDEGLVRIE